MSVLVVGTLAMDDVETPFGKREKILGGSATFAGTAASYFTDVGIVGVVGADFPRKNINYFKKKGIDTDGIETVKDGKTFHWSGYYDFNLNVAQTRRTDLNVLADFNPKIPQSYRDKKFVLLGNIDPELQMEVLNQTSDPKLVLCDTMNFWIEGKPDELIKVLKRVHVVCINDGEARQLCNEPNLVKAAQEILRLGVQQVIIKKGEHGCLLFNKDGMFSAPAFPLENLKDPTGAGDSFAGGFIGYLAKQRRMSNGAFRKAIIVGTTLASFCVEGFSVEASGKLTLDKIAIRSESLRRMSHFSRIILKP